MFLSVLSAGSGLLPLAPAVCASFPVPKGVCEVPAVQDGAWEPGSAARGSCPLCRAGLGWAGPGWAGLFPTPRGGGRAGPRPPAEPAAALPDRGRAPMALGELYTRVSGAGAGEGAEGKRLGQREGAVPAPPQRSEPPPGTAPGHGTAGHRGETLLSEKNTPFVRVPASRSRARCSRQRLRNVKVSLPFPGRSGSELSPGQTLKVCGRAGPQSRDCSSLMHLPKLLHNFSLFSCSHRSVVTYRLFA